MNPFASLYAGIANNLVKHPQQLLATAAAIFDPYWNTATRIEGEDDPDNFDFAVCVLRNIFPSIYAALIGMFNTKASPTQCIDFILNSVEEYGIAISDIEEFRYGVPVHGAGFDPYNYEGEARDSIVAAIEFMENHSHIDHSIFYAMIKDMQQHADEYPLLDVLAAAFAWFYSCSGNSLIDNNEESLSDYEPLEWTIENVEFMVELEAECSQIMGKINKGLTFLEAHPEFWNVVDTYIEHAKEGGENDNTFEWGSTGLDYSDHGNPSAGALVL